MVEIKVCEERRLPPGHVRLGETREVHDARAQTVIPSQPNE
jgi:hypothetical protein